MAIRGTLARILAGVEDSGCLAPASRRCADCPTWFRVTLAYGGDGARLFTAAPEPERCAECVAAAARRAAHVAEVARRAGAVEGDMRAIVETAGIPRHLGRCNLDRYDAAVNPKGFDPSDNPRAHEAALRYVAKVQSMGEADDVPWLIFEGDRGPGKTHLLVGMRRALYLAGFTGSVYLDNAETWVSRVQRGYSDGTAEELIRTRREADLWMVDDFARGKTARTPDAVEIMTETLIAREMRPTVLGWNLTPDDLCRLNPDYLRLASRMGRAYAVRIAMVGRDRRDDAAVRG